MTPKFSCVMIARNEEKTLPRMLASLKEFKNRNGEIILVDTGSTDQTVKIARDSGCIVEEVGERFLTTIDKDLALRINKHFCDGESFFLKEGDKIFDFSSSRNYASSLASNDVISCQDADEVYTHLDIDRINQLIDEGYTQFDYNFIFSHTLTGSPAIHFYQSKFYSRKLMEWTGIVHEVLTLTTKENVKKFTLPEETLLLEHWQNQETARGQYLKGLALDCYLNPEKDRNSHYFARELLWSDRPKSAIKEFKRHISMKRWPAEEAQSMIYIGDCEGKLGNVEVQKEWYHKAFAHDPTRRESFIKLCYLYRSLNKPQETLCYAKAAMEIPWHGFYANQREHYENIPHEFCYWSYGWLGRISEARYHILEALKIQPENSIYLRDTNYYITWPKVSIVIPTLGRKEKLQRCLDAIQKNANYSNYEVIVEEDSFENRQGCPITLKKGVIKATGELIMFLGNDCIPKENFLLLAVLHMMKYLPNGGLVGLNDNHSTKATHWLASKDLLNHLENREFFYTGYKHCYCDDELVDKISALGKYSWCKESNVGHDHPATKNWTEMDDIYRIEYDRDLIEHDRRLYEERRYPKFHESIDLKKRLSNTENLKVLNVGVGDCKSGLAQQLPYLRFKQLDHLDIHQSYLEEAKKIEWRYQPTNFIQGSIKDYDFSDYDYVLMFDVLEHLPKEDSIEILKRVKNGLIFIPLEKEFRENVFGVESQDHLSFWTEQDFIDLGFKTEVLEKFHGTFDALFASK